MKKHLVVIGVFLVLLLAACGGNTAQNESNPVDIVQAFYAAIKVEDVDGAMSLVADDAQFINPTGTYIGRDQVRENLSALAESNLAFDLRNVVNSNGHVTYGYTTYIDGEAVEEGSDGYTIVRDGLIIFDGTEATVPDSLRP